MEPALGLYFEGSLILLSKFVADQPFIAFALGAELGADSGGAGIGEGGSDYGETLPTSPAEELDLYNKLNYFKISGILISNSIWGAICGKYGAYLASRQINPFRVRKMERD